MALLFCVQGLAIQSNMISEDRCLFLLSGMNNTYTTEWKELYTNILNFIVSMYRIFMHYELTETDEDIMK